MKKEKEYLKKRIQIAEWPELERKMGIIARMTSEPLPRQDYNAEIPNLESSNSSSLPTEESTN
jgi:hypothetical protein